MKSFVVGQLITLCLVITSYSQSVNETKHANLDGTVALSGYDAVAYLIDGKALKGTDTFSFMHERITYKFATAKNLELFRKAPEKYKPAYGGWCAYAMGTAGEKVEVDPETFKVVDRKVYLFYNKYFNNTLTKWNEDEVRLKEQADTNWKKITQ